MPRKIVDYDIQAKDEEIEGLLAENTTLAQAVMQMKAQLDAIGNGRQEHGLDRSTGLIGFFKHAFMQPEFRLAVMGFIAILWVLYVQNVPVSKFTWKTDIYSISSIAVFLWWITGEYGKRGFMQLLMKCVVYFGVSMGLSFYCFDYAPWFVALATLLAMSRLTERISAGVVSVCMRLMQNPALSWVVRLFL